MILPSNKELKRLANACRRAGIKSLRCEGFEFTLSDYLPEKRTKSAQKAPTGGELKSVIDQDFETEELTQDQLLMWSTNAGKAEDA